MDNKSSFTIEEAGIEDVQDIYELINALADYEKMSDDVTGTPEMLKESLFGENTNIHALIARENNEAVGFALYFYNFSTFLCKKGLYLEDLFVRPQFRGKGYGKALFASLITIADKNGCGRMEWSVLKWNSPAIDFYKSFGAVDMDEWSVFRLTEDKLKLITNKNKSDL